MPNEGNFVFWKTNKRLKAMERILTEVLLYEKARTLLRDDIFSFQFEDQVLKFYLPYATREYVQKVILETGSFMDERPLQKTRKYINAESVVLDAGANIGNHTIFFSKICKARMVYSFEPLKTVFSMLEKNLELNGITHVSRHNLALGASSGFATIQGCTSANIGSTKFGMDDRGDFEVITLDSMDLKQLDFCKVDVEGMQLEFLKGAINTLERCKPVIWIEMLNREIATFGYNEDRELIAPQKILKDLGYILSEQLSPIDYLYVHSTAH